MKTWRGRTSSRVRAKDESEANVQVLEAKLALAEAKLAKLEIKAPFSGIVGIRNVSVGDYVKDGADLINLEDISSVKVDFRVPEKYADLARPGQTIEVMVDALPGKPFKRQGRCDRSASRQRRAFGLAARPDRQSARQAEAGHVRPRAADSVRA